MISDFFRRRSTAAITGATGLLGSALLEDMLRRDPELRVLAIARRGSRRPSLEATHAARVRWLEADLKEARWRPETLRALEWVNAGWWHCAASTSLASTPDVERDAMSTNAEGTARLLEIVHQVGSSARFFHISSAFVWGRQSGLVRELPVPQGVELRNPYERSKARAERYVLDHLARGGRGAIFRPGILVPPAGSPARGDQWPALLGRAVEHALGHGEHELVLRIEPGAGLNLVGLDWVVRVLGVLASSPHLRTRIFHLTATRDVALQDLTAAIERRVPGFRVRFAPGASDHDLPPASLWFDRCIAGVREYATARLDFDRAHTDGHLPAALAAEELDVDALAAACLHDLLPTPEMERVEHSRPVKSPVLQ